MKTLPLTPPQALAASAGRLRLVVVPVPGVKFPSQEEVASRSGTGYHYMQCTDWGEPETWRLVGPVGVARDLGAPHTLTSPFRPGERIWCKERVYYDDYRYSDKPLPKVKPADFQADALYYLADGSCCKQIPECQCASMGKPKWHLCPEWAIRFRPLVSRVECRKGESITEEEAILMGCPNDANEDPRLAAKFAIPGPLYFVPRFIVGRVAPEAWCWFISLEE